MGVAHGPPAGNYKKVGEQWLRLDLQRVGEKIRRGAIEEEGRGREGHIVESSGQLYTRVCKCCRGRAKLARRSGGWTWER